MYWCFLLGCVPGMALMGRSDSVLKFLAAVCTWDGVDGEVGQCIGVSCWGVYLGWR